MRNNYHYIISGLPQLILGTQTKSFNYEEIRNTILESASESDKRWVEWLEFGSNADNLTSHFYNAAFKCKNKFIKAFFKLDLLIRNNKVEYMAKKVHNKENDLAILKYAINPFKISPSEEDAIIRTQLEPVFSNPDILKKEEMLDQFKWGKINEMVPYGEFSIDTILAFLAKLMLIDRWNKLDPQKGAELFRQLVEEVKGTYIKENKN